MFWMFVFISAAAVPLEFIATAGPYATLQECMVDLPLAKQQDDIYDPQCLRFLVMSSTGHAAVVYNATKKQYLPLSPALEFRECDADVKHLRFAVMEHKFKTGDEVVLECVLFDLKGKTFAKLLEEPKRSKN